MSDLISRQDAIDAIDALHDKPNAWLEYAVDAVKKLPSAQPEIIRCRDCKHRYTDECPMRHVERVAYDDDGYIEYDDVVEDYTCDDGFCHKSRKENR